MLYDMGRHSIKYLFLPFLVLISVLLPLMALAETITETTLVSEASEISPGAKFRVGVVFKIKPGWHIYWKEPGDSGLPTKIDFQLPPGFTQSELKWPKHKEFVSAGNIKGNGYENKILLFSEIEAPQNLPVNTLNIGAKVSWLNCSDTLCVPEKARLDLNLTVTQLTKLDQSALFDGWQKQVPNL